MLSENLISIFLKSFKMKYSLKPFTFFSNLLLFKKKVVCFLIIELQEFFVECQSISGFYSVRLVNIFLLTYINILCQLLHITEVLKSGGVSLPNIIFCFKIVLTLQGTSHFHTHLRMYVHSFTQFTHSFSSLISVFKTDIFFIEVT